MMEERNAETTFHRQISTQERAYGQHHALVHWPVFPDLGCQITPSVDLYKSRKGKEPIFLHVLSFDWKGIIILGNRF